MSIAIVICPYCSLLTFANQVIFPKPYCVHEVVTPPVLNAVLVTQVKNNV